MEMCAKGVENNHRRYVKEEAHSGVAAAFQAYRRPLESVRYFKYLGRFLTASYNYWPSVVSIFSKFQRRLARFTRILGWRGEDAFTSSNFLQGIFPVYLLVQIRNLGGEPHNREDPRRLPPQGSLPIGWYATTVQCAREV